jgi:hypothetical protein
MRIGVLIKKQGGCNILLPMANPIVVPDRAPSLTPHDCDIFLDKPEDAKKFPHRLRQRRFPHATLILFMLAVPVIVLLFRVGAAMDRNFREWFTKSE